MRNRLSYWNSSYSITQRRIIGWSFDKSFEDKNITDLNVDIYIGRYRYLWKIIYFYENRGYIFRLSVAYYYVGLLLLLNPLLKFIVLAQPIENQKSPKNKTNTANTWYILDISEIYLSSKKLTTSLLNQNRDINLKNYNIFFFYSFSLSTLEKEILITQLSQKGKW